MIRLFECRHYSGLIEVTIVVSAQDSNQSKDLQTSESLAYIRQILAELRFVAEREGA